MKDDDILTAELKVNNQVIGTFEARRIIGVHPDTGLPWYSCKAWADNPRGGKVGMNQCVETHDPDRDFAWDLVRLALTSGPDIRVERDEARERAASWHRRCVKAEDERDRLQARLDRTIGARIDRALDRATYAIVRMVIR